MAQHKVNQYALRKNRKKKKDLPNLRSLANKMFSQTVPDKSKCIYFSIICVLQF